MLPSSGERRRRRERIRGKWVHNTGKLGRSRAETANSTVFHLRGSKSWTSTEGAVSHGFPQKCAWCKGECSIHPISVPICESVIEWSGEKCLCYWDDSPISFCCFLHCLSSTFTYFFPSKKHKDWPFVIFHLWHFEPISHKDTHIHTLKHERFGFFFNAWVLTVTWRFENDVIIWLSVFSSNSNRPEDTLEIKSIPVLTSL